MTTSGIPSGPQDPAGATPPVRRIDARSLRGLAHPLRMRIFELLRDGPATSARLAERLGENTGTVSWHLRHLAEHGFIVEDETLGTKRERWWKAARVTNVLSTTDFLDDPESRAALSVYMHELLQNYFTRITRYLAEDWEAEWRDAGTISDWNRLRLTPAQLQALNSELMEVIARHTPPEDAEPLPGALPVSVQLQSFPRKDPGAGA